MALQLGQLVSFSSVDTVVLSHRLCPAVFLLREIRSKDLVICEENLPVGVCLNLWLSLTSYI